MSLSLPRTPENFGEKKTLDRYQELGQPDADRATSASRSTSARRNLRAADRLQAAGLGNWAPSTAGGGRRTAPHARHNIRLFDPPVEHAFLFLPYYVDSSNCAERRGRCRPTDLLVGDHHPVGAYRVLDAVGKNSTSSTSI